MNRVVFGLGSPHGDDQAGWLIIDCLRGLGYPNHLLHKGTNPADLLDILDRDMAITICDACQDASLPGSVHCWRWPTSAIMALRSSGSHDLSLPDVLQIAHSLDRRPEDLEIWGVNGAIFTPASPPSQLVLDGSTQLAQQLWRTCRA